MKKNLCIFFAMLLTLSLLVSCGGGEKEEQKTAEDTTETERVTEAETEIVKSPLNIVADGRTDYKIVYSKNAGGTLSESLSALATKLNSLTTEKIASGNDTLSADETAGEYEILIGKTNRTESTEISASLRKGEYTVEISGTKLVVCGFDDETTVKAIEKLIEIVTKNAGNQSFSFSPDYEYRKTAKFYVDSATLNGKPLGAYKIVVPATGYVEYYVAVLFRQYLQAYTGFSPEVVTDETAKSDCEIRLGLTNRDNLTVEDGKYAVAVTDDGLVAVASSDTGYLGLLTALKQNVFPNSKSVVAVKSGDNWNGDDNSVETPACEGTLRIMYHNTWGYLNSDGSNPMANRADLALTVYKRYAPDILCMEESGPNWEKSAKALKAWLTEDYGELRFSSQGGSGNPIYYKKSTVELVASGYEKSRNGDKGTTWGVFREKSSGKIFAVTDSHFAADTNAGGDATLGVKYRAQDAGVVVSVKNSILETYGSIPVISGGDFNCYKDTEPYNVLTDGGFVSLRDKAERVDDHSAYHGSFAYNEEFGIYPLQSKLPYTGAQSIDHIMTCGAEATFHCYEIVSDSIALTSSDHAPHYTDITLK